MQADIDPLLQIIPFDEKYAVKAELTVEKQSRKLFMMKTFLMFVLQIRSAMDQDAIKTLKIFILETCQQLIQRGGIDNIGFVINKNYYTIRNPNYEGIKDLLNANVKVEDTTDIRDTLICLRNSIQLEAKKLQSAKISLFMFSSNVAQNPLIPMKRTYRLQKNRYIYNYERQIQRLKNTITAYCDDCYFYSIGYFKKYGNNKQKQFGWMGCGDYGNQGIDVALLYKVSNICKRKQFTFNICDSYTQLRQKFRQVSALILYEFHQFSLMVPVRNTKKYTFNPELGSTDFMKDAKEQKNQRMEEEEDINDQELQQYFKKHKEEKIEQQQVEENSDDQTEYIAKGQFNKDIKYVKLVLTNKDEIKFTTEKFTYFDKVELNLEQIHQNGYHLFNKVQNKKEFKFPQKMSIIKKMAYTYTPQYVSNKVYYHQPNSIELITLQSDYYKQELSDIICQLRSNILSYKKRFVGTYKKTKIFETYLEVDEELQNKLRGRLYNITQTVKQMYDKIFKDQLIRNEKQKRKMYEHYTSIKSMIDTTNQVFLSINKKQIKNQDIGKLSAALNYDKIKSSLKRKLIKRVNSNPKMLDDVYDKIEVICNKQIGSFVDLQAKYKHEKSQVGNCMYTFRNFATSLRQKDCLGVVFQIQRPDSAIADPGRIRIRQVSTLVSGVSKFFQVHQYLIKTEYQTAIDQALNNFKANLEDVKKLQSVYCPLCKYQCDYILTNNIVDILRKANCKQGLEQLKDRNAMRQKIKFGLQKSDYKENWDYWNRVESKQTFFGIMPLYICDDNWKVAKQLMKPCMGWTAAAEPLGYSYSQTQTIPFMVLSSLIRSIQQTTYKIKQLQDECTKVKIQQKYKIQHTINLLKHKRERHEQLLKHTSLTCQAIMKDMSGVNQQNPFNQQVIKKFQDYSQPICRTVDIINNNSSFISQLYTVINLKMMDLPTEQKFHEFFKRLVQEQLRRQTDGWNEEQVEDKFVNKLLNVKVEQMDKPEYHVLDSAYLDKFQQAQQGQAIYRTQFQIQREQLQMIIKENNKFNDTQRMSIIQYKRLYENRVLWLWYVRFRLYKEKNRIQIHKWKSLDLTNSYQLFTMIIQNKKQRKNWKRRQEIMNGNYVDPFDYYQARQYLEGEFIRMRNKKQAHNVVLLNAEKYGKASRVFARTKDIREAAGAVMNVEIGKQIKYYYQQLLSDSNFIEEKLKILLHGEFLGVTLFKHGWKMSKQKMNKLRNRYRYEFQLYQYKF